MSHVIFDKEETKRLAVLSLVVCIALQIAFYKEGILGALRGALGILWLFIIPGYCLLLRWRSRIGFLERTILGSLLSAGILGILSYYLGILGADVRTHAIILPPLLMSAGIIFAAWDKKGQKE